MNTEHHSISRRTGLIGGLTLISRIFGLVRDAVLAYVFGATMMADAFYVAFRIPNLLRRFVAEGALTVAFIPVYTEYLKKAREQGREAASVIFTWLSLLLTLIVLTGILFSPWIVRLMAWGFTDDPQKFQLTVFLTRLMFPYIFLMSLVALAMGILNSLKRFSAPAASPIFLNLSIIFGALVLRHWFSIPTVGLALGVLLGGLLQLLLQIPSLVKEGMLPSWNFQLRHPALKGLLFLMIPAAFGAAVYQVNLLVITLLASFLPEGSVSYLWYADRISEFPIGVFGIAVATATLPTLSDYAAEKDMSAFKETMNYSLRLSFLISIPAAVGLMLLAKPIVAILFQRGEFTETTTIATAGALAFYALKIPFLSGVRNLAPGFFALKDAKTPVVVSAFAVGVNAIAAFLLMQSMLHLGLALALTISTVANFTLLLWLFRKKTGLIGGRKLFLSIGKTLLATLVMGIAIIAGMEYWHPLEPASLLEQITRLSIFVIIGSLLFLLTIRFLNREEYHALMGLVRRRVASREMN